MGPIDPEWETPFAKKPTDDNEIGDLNIRVMSDITIRPIRWLWPQRIARGKLTILAGNPGLGKSLVTADMASKCSTGGTWPVDGTECPQGNVLVLSGEDDAEDTFKPRLIAADADLSCIHTIDSVTKGFTGKGQKETRVFNLQQDIDALTKAFHKIGNVILLIIDPITAFLGDIDSHRNSEVRGLLTPLCQITAKHGAALIGVSHLNKTGGNEALMRVTGSLAFTAAARAAYLFIQDPEDPDRCLFLPMKNNIGPRMPGLAYTIEKMYVPIPEGKTETARIRWCLDSVQTSADNIMQAQSARPDSAMREAETWLTQTLASAGGRASAATLYQQATQRGISERTLSRASGAIGVVKKRSGFSGAVYWSLRSHASQDSVQ